MHRVGSEEATNWLREAVAESGHSGYTGFSVEGWDASTWVLNAMYAYVTPLPQLSADELRRQRIATGEIESLVINGVDLDEVATTTGAPLGRSHAPGPEWRRLRWSELADRTGAPLADSGTPPCFRWFSYSRWPTQIRPPAEGSLDRESFLRLAAILSNQPGSSRDMRVWCYYSPLATVEGPARGPVVIEATLAELPDIYDWPEVCASPSNIWPEDRSWFVYSDWDLSGTRVSGTAKLIDAVVADLKLETINYP